MNARIETYSRASNLSDAGTYLRTSLLPQLHQEPGYVGGMASIDEAAGLLALISLWADSSAVTGSAIAAVAAREAIVNLSGAEVSLEMFGQVVSKVGDPPPQTGCPVRFVPFRLDAVPSDSSGDPVASSILPRIARAPGFRASRSFTNVRSEHGLLVIIMSDEAGVVASEADFLARRADDAARGISFEAGTRRRVLQVDRPQPGARRDTGA